jgi:hypothetical protein
MSSTFQAHDAERFAGFECATCHTGMGDGDVSMPAVHPIDFADAGSWPPGYYNGDGSGLMEVVTAEMAGILGMEPFNPDTGEGFGCYSCHTSP